MRNMSFFMTTQQIKNRTKSVTRRFGWWFLKPGDRIQACEKCQGLKKGEKINKLTVIAVVSAWPEPLDTITEADCIREGFPEMTPFEFTMMLVKHYGCDTKTTVNRIEFKYVKGRNGKNHKTKRLS